MVLITIAIVVSFYTTKFKRKNIMIKVNEKSGIIYSFTPYIKEESSNSSSKTDFKKNGTNSNPG